MSLFDIFIFYYCKKKNKMKINKTTLPEHEQAGKIEFTPVLKIDITANKWRFWLKSENETSSQIVYKSPLTQEERSFINDFTEEKTVIICSDTNDSEYRSESIIELMMKYSDDFKEFHGFNHFYYLFEFSTEKPILMEELGQITIKLAELLTNDNANSLEYWWAAKNNNTIGSKLKVTIQAGKF